MPTKSSAAADKESKYSQPTDVSSLPWVFASPTFANTIASPSIEEAFRESPRVKKN